MSSSVLGATDGTQPDIDKLTVQWENLKASDDLRQTLVERLFKALKKAHEDNEHLQEEVENLKFHERHFLKERKDLNKKNESLQDRLSTIKETNPFVMVLVDGDNTLFKDSFVEAGTTGGHKAAQALQTELDIYLRNLLGTQAHRKIVIRIYVNLVGLAGAYIRAGVFPESKTFRDFVMGFNRELPLAEFIDVGGDKEAADNKVKENFSLYWNNQHCKHIILAGSSDNGYISFLRPFRTGDDFKSKLTLIEAVPFQPAFRELSEDFQTTKFQDLFRSSKLVTEEVPIISSTPVTSGISYANASRKPAAPSVPEPKTNSNNVNSSKPLRKMYFNRLGQRVDPKLDRWDPDIVHEFSGKGLCNRYYLTHCDNGANCSYVHGPKLTETEKTSLWRVARLSRCQYGPYCDDRNCVAAHQCIRPAPCEYGDQCKYGPSMHGMDTKVTEVL